MRAGLQRVELAAEQAQDRGRIAQGAACGDVHALRAPVHPKEHGGDAARAFVVARHEAAGLLREREQHVLDIGARAHALRVTALDHIGGRLEARRDGRLRAPHHRIEAGEHLRAEPRGDGRARTHGDVADGLETGLRQRQRDLLRQAQGGDGQRMHGARERLFVACGQDARGAGSRMRELRPKTRQRPCGLGGVRDRRARAKACETGFDQTRQRRLAAEQMRGARHVEHEPVGRIAGDERRVAAAGLRERDETGARVRRPGRKSRQMNAKITRRQ